MRSRPSPPRPRPTSPPCVRVCAPGAATRSRRSTAPHPSGGSPGRPDPPSHFSSCPSRSSVSCDEVLLPPAPAPNAVALPPTFADAPAESSNAPVVMPETTWVARSQSSPSSWSGVKLVWSASKRPTIVIETVQLPALFELSLELRRADGHVRVEVVRVLDGHRVVLGRDRGVGVLARQLAPVEHLHLAADVADGDEAALRLGLQRRPVGGRPLDDERVVDALSHAALGLVRWDRTKAARRGATPRCRRRESTRRAGRAALPGRERRRASG